jgi:hypothetical protein
VGGVVSIEEGLLVLVRVGNSVRVEAEDGRDGRGSALHRGRV